MTTPTDHLARLARLQAARGPSQSFGPGIPHARANAAAALGVLVLLGAPAYLVLAVLALGLLPYPLALLVILAIPAGVAFLLARIAKR